MWHPCDVTADAIFKGSWSTDLWRLTAFHNGSSLECSPQCTTVETLPYCRNSNKDNVPGEEYRARPSGPALGARITDSTPPVCHADISGLTNRQWPKTSDFVARFCTLRKSKNLRPCENRLAMPESLAILAWPYVF